MSTEWRSGHPWRRLSIPSQQAYPLPSCTPSMGWGGVGHTDLHGSAPCSCWLAAASICQWQDCSTPPKPGCRIRHPLQPHTGAHSLHRHLGIKQKPWEIRQQEYQAINMDTQQINLDCPGGSSPLHGSKKESWLHWSEFVQQKYILKQPLALPSPF